MRIFSRILLWLVAICVALYVGVCAFFYFYQEHLIFPGTKVASNYHYNFQLPNQQYHIKTSDGDTIDGYLFKTPNPKGVIFYLHGNGDNVDSWSEAVVKYTNMGYDAFEMDYPGYGKSTGSIHSLGQVFNSVQAAYDTVKRLYPENRIIIMGYSIGTGPAAWLAEHEHPKLLLLLAPYYSLGDMATYRYPFLPQFILKYPINTYEYLQQVKAPVVIFHGDVDDVIYYGSSLKLKPYLKPGDRLITLKGQGHMDFDENKAFMTDLEEILTN
jgi:pimeloyl-ACP methyl ester carboxylesterase